MINKTLEKTEGAITNGQSRETGNIGYQKEEKHNENTNICVGHYTQTNTNNVLKQDMNQLSYKQLEVKTNRTSFL